MMALPPYAEVANYRLERGDGRVGVMLLHGLGGDLEQLWLITDGYVAGRAGTKLALDARAHGRTPLLGPRPLNFGLLAEDALRLADRLEIGDHLVVVGVSMGAAMALTLALKAPARVTALILLRPAWAHQPMPSHLAPIGEIGALLRQYGPGEGREIFAHSCAYLDVAAKSASAAASLLAQFDKPQSVQRAHRLEEMPRSVPYRDPQDLRCVTVPTLVVGAPRDPLHPLGVAEDLSGRLASASLRVVTPRDEDPNRYEEDQRRVVQRFLGDLSLRIAPSPSAAPRRLTSEGG
jgi:pimeloyl-ACP methyl ester carboxylesterase